MYRNWESIYENELVQFAV